MIGLLDLFLLIVFHLVLMGTEYSFGIGLYFAHKVLVEMSRCVWLC